MVNVIVVVAMVAGGFVSAGGRSTSSGTLPSYALISSLTCIPDAHLTMHVPRLAYLPLILR